MINANKYQRKTDTCSSATAHFLNSLLLTTALGVTVSADRSMLKKKKKKKTLLSMQRDTGAHWACNYSIVNSSGDLHGRIMTIHLGV
jgi:hypothetical protein